jgi:hypothetical protein
VGRRRGFVGMDPCPGGPFMRFRQKILRDRPLGTSHPPTWDPCIRNALPALPLAALPAARINTRVSGERGGVGRGGAHWNSEHPPPYRQGPACDPPITPAHGRGRPDRRGYWPLAQKVCVRTVLGAPLTYALARPPIVLRGIVKVHPPPPYLQGPACDPPITTAHGRGRPDRRG